MLTFDFRYLQHKITFKADSLGKEYLYIDDELIKSSFNWRRSREYTFTLAGKELTIKVLLVALKESDLVVRLFDGDEIIASERQSFNIGILSDKKVTFSDAEVQWKEEIEFSSATYGLAWLVYGLLALYTFLTDFEQDYIIYGLIVVLAFASFLFIKQSISALKSSSDDDELLEQI